MAKSSNTAALLTFLACIVVTHPLPLHMAAKLGDVAFTKRLLETGAVVDALCVGERLCPPYTGYTPLMIASRYGHENISRILVNVGGARINPTNDDGQTALVLAAQYGHDKVIDFLLSKTPDLEEVDKLGMTALARAIIDKHYNVVARLIDAGANANTVHVYTGSLMTPLMIACKNGELAMVKILISGNADVNAKMKGGVTALHIAAEHGLVEIAQVILKHEGAHTVDERGFTPLLCATEKGNDNVVKLFIAEGADIDGSDAIVNKTGGWTPLMVALQHGHKHIFDMLFAAGADVNAMNDKRQTPLFLAAKFGYTQIVDRLLSAVDDANVLTENGHSALYIASIQGNLQVVMTLLDWGVSLQVKSYITPLMGASAKGETEIIKALIAAGADINAREHGGATALMFAAQEGHIGVVKVLLTFDADVHVQKCLPIINMWCYTASQFTQNVSLKSILEEAKEQHSDAERLSFFLAKHDLSTYNNDLRANGYVRLRDLADISRDELRRIGVTKRGHQQRLLAALEDLGLDLSQSDSNSPAEREVDNFQDRGDARMNADDCEAASELYKLGLETAKRANLDTRIAFLKFKIFQTEICLGVAIMPLPSPEKANICNIKALRDEALRLDFENVAHRRKAKETQKWFDLLELEEWSCSVKAVKKQHRQMMRQYHPDKNNNKGNDEKECAHQMSLFLNAAKEVVMKNKACQRPKSPKYKEGRKTRRSKEQRKASDSHFSANQFYALLYLTLTQYIQYIQLFCTKGLAFLLG
jgi:ankyrin repeat protein